jgi:hypothetical protein
MPSPIVNLQRWVHRRRRPLRYLIGLALVVLLIEGFFVERSAAHLMLLHPILFLALLGGWALTADPDER